MCPAFRNGCRHVFEDGAMDDERRHDDQRGDWEWLWMALVREKRYGELGEQSSFGDHPPFPLWLYVLSLPSDGAQKVGNTLWVPFGESRESSSPLKVCRCSSRPRRR